MIFDFQIFRSMRRTQKAEIVSSLTINCRWPFYTSNTTQYEYNNNTIFNLYTSHPTINIIFNLLIFSFITFVKHSPRKRPFDQSKNHDRQFRRIYETIF
jgi:hypothetical protein